MTQLITRRGYDFYEVSSAMQKAIRRGDARLAGYWAIELFESGFFAYIWKRLFTISAEDCWGIITKEIQDLYSGFMLVNASGTKDSKWKGRIFIAKAVILLSEAKKSRDADHLTNLVYDAQMGITAEELEKELMAARADGIEKEEIPEYAFDCHTRKGKRMGKTKAQFFKEEHSALAPRQQGLFDNLITEG